MIDEVVVMVVVCGRGGDSGGGVWSRGDGGGGQEGDGGDGGDGGGVLCGWPLSVVH